jgi:hypothetical protein
VVVFGPASVVVPASNTVTPVPPSAAVNVPPVLINTNELFVTGPVRPE